MSDLFEDQPHTFTLSQMVSCAEREVIKRKAAYPRFIESGMMSEAKARHEIDCMQAIADKLKGERDGQA